MKIKIEIECETIGEIVSHLGVITDEITTEGSKKNMTYNDYFVEDVTIMDSNCYGEHIVNIKSD